MNPFSKASAVPWPVALPAAALLHAAVLSLNLGSSAALNDGDARDALRIAVVEGELEPLEIVRAAAAEVHDDNAQEFAARLEGLPLQAPPGEHARPGTLQPASAAVVLIETTAPDVQHSARVLPDGAEAGAFDAPLEPLGLAPAQAAAALESGAETGVAGHVLSASGGAESGGNGEGGRAKVRGSGSDLFSRVATQMIAEQQRAPFVLKGQPAFPRACREGLCRRGASCEGSSEWRVSVPAAGGTPSKVEAVRPLECELQNASIRKFFSDYKFPSADRPRIFVFPVEMRIAR